MQTPKIDLLLGNVREVVDRLTYEITADIPGVATEVRAYPFSRGEMDEPVVGNLIYLISVDPVYHSFYLYTKVKENDFIGIRSNGKLIDITPDSIILGVYDTEKVSSDEEHPESSTSYIKLDSSGNIEIMATGDEKVTISGSVSIEVSGDANIKVSGKTTLDSSEVNITGGKLSTPNGGDAVANGMGGFCGVKNCIFSGAPHVTNTISNT